MKISCPYCGDHIMDVSPSLSEAPDPDIKYIKVDCCPNCGIPSRHKLPKYWFGVNVLK